MTAGPPPGEWAPPTDVDGIHAATGTGHDLVLRREGPVAVLTLNRAEKRNALTGEMSWGLARVLRALSEDTSVRACVITGAPPAFCAGGDVGTFPVSGGAQAPPYRPARAEIYPPVAIRDAPFPVIAAVNGVAAGAGFALALACDLAIADPGARFGALQVKRGLVADWGLTWLLVRAVGRGRALELLWSGDWVDAPGAQALGLVNRVSAAGATLDEALRWAAELAAGPSAAMTLMKRAAHRAVEMSLEEALETDSLMQARAFGTADAAEGARAFMEKRPPQFKGC